MFLFETLGYEVYPNKLTFQKIQNIKYSNNSDEVEYRVNDVAIEENIRFNMPQHINTFQQGIIQTKTISKDIKLNFKTSQNEIELDGVAKSLPFATSTHRGKILFEFGEIIIDFNDFQFNYHLNWKDESLYKIKRKADFCKLIFDKSEEIKIGIVENDILYNFATIKKSILEDEEKDRNRLLQLINCLISFFTVNSLSLRTKVDLDLILKQSDLIFALANDNDRVENITSEQSEFEIEKAIISRIVKINLGNSELVCIVNFVGTVFLLPNSQGYLIQKLTKSIYHCEISNDLDIYKLNRLYENNINVYKQDGYVNL